MGFLPSGGCTHLSTWETDSSDILNCRHTNSPVTLLPVTAEECWPWDYFKLPTGEEERGFCLCPFFTFGNQLVCFCFEQDRGSVSEPLIHVRNNIRDRLHRYSSINSPDSSVRFWNIQKFPTTFEKLWLVLAFSFHLKFFNCSVLFLPLGSTPTRVSPPLSPPPHPPCTVYS